MRRAFPHSMYLFNPRMYRSPCASVQSMSPVQTKVPACAPASRHNRTVGRIPPSVFVTPGTLDHIFCVCDAWIPRLLGPACLVSNDEPARSACPFSGFEGPTSSFQWADCRTLQLLETSITHGMRRMFLQSENTSVQKQEVSSYGRRIFASHKASNVSVFLQGFPHARRRKTTGILLKVDGVANWQHCELLSKHALIWDTGIFLKVDGLAKFWCCTYFFINVCVDMGCGHLAESGRCGR